MRREANIRVGTAERERAVAALSDHFTAGRIDVTEYEQRCAAATTARTRGDLRAVFDDLPAPHPEFHPASAPVKASAPGVERPSKRLPRSAKRRRTNNLIIGGFLVASLALIAAVTTLTGSWWALAPALVIAAIVVMVAS